MRVPCSPADDTYTWRNFAGLQGGPGSADGTGSAARFNDPWCAATDGEGNLYVADTNNNTIRRVTPTGVATTLAGLAGSYGSTDGTGSAARFRYPIGVAADSAGNVYVDDTNNHTIRKVAPTGVVTTLAGLAGSYGSTDGAGSAARFCLPCGVAADRAGNLYVADRNNHTIRKVTSAGVVSTFAGKAGYYGSADGAGGTARFWAPCGLAADAAGNLYVADTGNHTIRKVTPAGAVTTLAGLAGWADSADGKGGAARFYYPYGVAVDSAGTVYVSDTYNHTIRKVTPAGDVTTIGGTAGVTGSADGVGSSAGFSSPSGIAVDPAGILYVADSGNNRISRGFTRLPGDVDGDGYVDVIDLLALADAWSSVTGDPTYDPACDFNGDGSVDVLDLLTLAETWGT